MAAVRRASTTGGTEVHGVWPRAAKGFHHGGTEVHGVWPRCERLSPRGRGDAGVWLTWRRIQPAVAKVDFQYLQGRGETARMVVSFLRGPIVLARP